MVAKDTKVKILDAAEKLFSENGIATTSLRSIICKAKVNIAAIHYHFGSKPQLVLEVYKRRIEPLNTQRMKLISELREKYGDEPIPVYDIVMAFIGPILNCRPGDAKAVRSFKGLMSRLHMEPEVAGQVIQMFLEVFETYMRALSEAVPHVTYKELKQRFIFMIGVMGVAFFDKFILPESAKKMMQEETTAEGVLKYAAEFITAGIQAPPVEPKVEEKNEEIQ